MYLYYYIPSLIFIVTISSNLPSFSESSYGRYDKCAPLQYPCGNKTFSVSYPFRVYGQQVHPDYCGDPNYYLFCNNISSTITFYIKDKGYIVKDVDYMNHLLTIVDPNFSTDECPQQYQNISIDSSMFVFSDSNRNITLLTSCNDPSSVSRLNDTYHNTSCLFHRHPVYYHLNDNGSYLHSSGKCNITVIQMNLGSAEQLIRGNLNFTEALKEGFSLRWVAGLSWCTDCINSGGRCGYNMTVPHSHTCYCKYGPVFGLCSPDSSSKKAIIAGSVAASSALFLLAILFLLYKKSKNVHHCPSSKSLTTNPFLNHQLTKNGEMSSAYYKTHLFSYDELQEATNYFESARELGDGGFGTVYKGELRDGRTVAIKRLYENNYNRLAQFMNEIKILSELRHKNLVNLYGCTSHRSRELLLVYEFVSNGTVADHLHGSRAKEGILTWPLRLQIAVETADALAYLHSVEPPIIHRDVKTNNILLDCSFHVKLADFGLSRLVPTDVTHVSTAPQGTPGYMDPMYQQCYQLTEKSDVYSFGVVLVELISSKTPVDISRHRSEINLANMAVSKIQNGELDQLVDMALGYQSDSSIGKMITVVAELAFRCLQLDGDMRPPIKEVLEVLRSIYIQGYKLENKGDDDARTWDDPQLLKNIAQFSPNTVMDQWMSRSTTPNTSM